MLGTLSATGRAGVESRAIIPTIKQLKREDAVHPGRMLSGPCVVGQRLSSRPWHSLCEDASVLCASASTDTDSHLGSCMHIINACKCQCKNCHDWSSCAADRRTVAVAAGVAASMWERTVSMWSLTATTPARAASVWWVAKIAWRCWLSGRRLTASCGAPSSGADLLRCQMCTCVYHLSGFALSPCETQL